MHELIRLATAELARFLGSKLPGLSADWWHRQVVDRLSHQQQRMVQERNLRTLQQLDFAALLRVFDQNWHELSGANGLPREGRTWVRELQAVRNKWAHLSVEPVADSERYRDADTLGRVMELIGAAPAVLNKIDSEKAAALAAMTGRQKPNAGAGGRNATSDRRTDAGLVPQAIRLPTTDLKGNLIRFYESLDRLAKKHGGRRELGSTDGRMIWPRRGVYFFFEPGEQRSGSGLGQRVVRLGTHALKTGSGSTLWGRLAQHRGATTGGNHRGSIVRQLVGLAIANRHPELRISTWGSGTSASSQVTEQERELEARVSAILARMQVLWLAIDDEPGPQSLRGFIERNSIALLSAYRHPAIDPPSPDWLGYHCLRERVTKSGLWNSNHVDEAVDPTFLDILEQLTGSGLPSPRSAEAGHQTVDNSRVRTGGNADLIIAELQRWPDLDDDELARRAGVSPRQQVNIICRRLEQLGLLKRSIGLRGKIVNRLTGINQTGTPVSPIEPLRLSTQPAPTTVKVAPTPINPATRLTVAMADTMIIIPCSARKCDGSQAFDDLGTLLGELPDSLAGRLEAARRAIAGMAHLDESRLMPAWHRYNGTLYQSAHHGIERAQDTCWFRHLLILSGGYGIVRAVDPIGTYDLAMEENRWPPGLLQEVIETYARLRKIRRMLAVVSETTGYARILQKVAWGRAGVSDALLLTPEASTGAMVKAPRAIGEALVTIMTGGLDSSWRSSDGLEMLARHLA